MLLPPRRGAPPRSAWTHQAERPHQRNKAGRAVFRRAPGPRPSRAGARARLGTLVGLSARQKRPSMNSSPSNPHPQSLGRNPLNPPRFGGRSAPFPTCPSPLARGEGLNGSAPQDVPRERGVGLPRSAARHPAPAAPGFVPKATPSHPHHSGQAPQDMPRGRARWCPGPRPSRPPAPRLGSVYRATPSHPEQAAPGSRTRLTAGYTDATHRLPRQSAPEPLREPGTFA